MNTDERIHVYCCNASTHNNNNNSNYLEDMQKLMQNSNSAQIIFGDDEYATTHYFIQNQLNDELKYNSINLLSSFWNNIF